MKSFVCQDSICFSSSLREMTHLRKPFRDVLHYLIRCWDMNRHDLNTGHYFCRMNYFICRLFNDVFSSDSTAISDGILHNSFCGLLYDAISVQPRGGQTS